MTSVYMQPSGASIEYVLSDVAGVCLHIDDVAVALLLWSQVVSLSPPKLTRRALSLAV